MQTYLKLNNEAYESFMEYFKHILQHANSYGSKSSILSPLIWIILGVLAPLIVSSIFAPPWVSYLLAVVFVSFLCLMAFAYIYCLLKGKTDELRSEKFNIEKLAIEKQISGDSLTGAEREVRGVQLPQLTQSQVEDDQQ